MTNRLQLFLAMGALFLPCGRLPAETLAEGWPFRRQVTLKQIASDAPGTNLGWVDLYLTPDHKGDGADIRVTTADRTLVPSKVLHVSAGHDLARVVFATNGDGPYYIWWGNVKAEKLPKDVDLRRGVVMEVSRPTPAALRGGTTRPVIVTTEPESLGTYFLSEIGTPFNPTDIRLATFHYTAMFKINPRIAPLMQLNFNGTGTASIDGKPLVNHRSTTVELAAGWHTLDIRQINPPAGAPTLALTWQRPGEKSFTAFPNSLIAQAARGVAGALETPGSAAPADVTVEALAELPVAANVYAQRYAFEAVVPANVRFGYNWQFDDGQTSTLKRINHIFLTPGIHPVVLMLTTADGKAEKKVIRVPIQARMYERLPRPPGDAPATVKAILKDYVLDKLPTEDAFRGMQLAATNKDDDLRAAFGRAWLAGTDFRFVPSDGVVLQETEAVARLFSGRKQYKEAAEIFRLAARKPIGLEARLALARREVMTLCDEVDDPAGAVEEARAWLERATPTNPGQARLANVALAYALIAAEDGAGARAAIEAAVTPPAPLPAARPAVPQAPLPPPAPEDYARLMKQVETAVGKKEMATASGVVTQFELDYPQALWEGATRLLRVRIVAAEGLPAEAARLARQHAMANPEGANAAELLFRAYEQYKAAKDETSARAMMDRLHSKYGNTPYGKGTGVLSL